MDFSDGLRITTRILYQVSSALSSGACLEGHLNQGDHYHRVEGTRPGLSLKLSHSCSRHQGGPLSTLLMQLPFFPPTSGPPPAPCLVKTETGFWRDITNFGCFLQASPPVAAAEPGHLLLSMLPRPTSTLQVSSCLRLGAGRTALEDFDL